MNRKQFSGCMFFALLIGASVACKPSGTSSMNAIAGENSSNSPICKEPKTWQSNVCGANKNQIIVDKLVNLSGELKTRLEARGIKLCAGEIRFYNDKAKQNAWDSGIGVWLEAYNLGCHTGIGYRKAGTGHGANVVTPLSSETRYDADAGMIYRPAWGEQGFNKLTGSVGYLLERGSNLLLDNLCTGYWEDSCTIRVENSTLAIDLPLRKTASR